MDPAPPAPRGPLVPILVGLVLFGVALGVLDPRPEPGPVPVPAFTVRRPPAPARPPGLAAKLPATVAGILVLAALAGYPWRRRGCPRATRAAPFTGGASAGGLGGTVPLPRGRFPDW